jgi:DNA-binding MarR family transcriptional regulator
LASTLPDDEDLVGRLRLAVTRLSRVFRQDGHSQLVPTDVAILTAIAWASKTTLGSLAASEHVAPPTVTKSVNRLTELGFVERVADPTDGRVTWVRLSKSGNREVSAYRARVNGWLEDRLNCLPGDDRESLARSVRLLEHLVGQTRPETASGEES